MSAADYVGNSGLHSGKENEAKEKKSLNFIGSRRRKAIERHSGLKKLTGNSVKWPKPLFKTSEQLHQLHSSGTQCNVQKLNESTSAIRTLAVTTKIGIGLES